MTILNLTSQPELRILKNGERRELEISVPSGNSSSFSWRQLLSQVFSDTNKTLIPNDAAIVAAMLFLAVRHIGSSCGFTVTISADHICVPQFFLDKEKEAMAALSVVSLVLQVALLCHHVIRNLYRATGL